MKRLHKSGLFYFSMKGDIVRVYFTTIPKCVKSYEVEPCGSGRKLPNVMIYWNFKEGDKLHVFLADKTHTFIARNGEMTEEKEEIAVSNHEHNFDDCPEDELKHIFGLYSVQKNAREQEYIEIQELLDACKKG